MKLCTHCGKENLDDAAFCESCGRSLAGPNLRPEPSPPAPSPTVTPTDSSAGAPSMFGFSGEPPGVAAAPGTPPAAPLTPPETSGKAIGSLVSGIFFFFFPAAVTAVVLGHIARAEVRRSAGRLQGSGMALAGLILGYVGLSVLPILIIAAIAIPNLLKARIAANEASAVSALRSINTACFEYRSHYSGYPASLASLGPPPGRTPGREGADLIESALAGGTKSGYAFRLEAHDDDADGYADRYQVWADPVIPGQRHFFTDETGLIRARKNAPADAGSYPIE